MSQTKANRLKYSYYLVVQSPTYIRNKILRHLFHKNVVLERNVIIFAAVFQ